MVVERYDPQDLFTLIPGRTLHFDPVLARLDRLLDDDQLCQQVQAALRTRFPFSTTRGRPGTPVEAVLRLLVVQRLYGWSFAELEARVADSLTLRQFCRIYLHAVPDDTVLIRLSALLGPATLEALHRRVVELAVQAQVTRGRKLRIDTTVVKTTIHPPTDSSLLTDGVRVLSRLCRQAREVLEVVGAAATLGKEGFRDRTRSMRQAGRRLRQVLRSKRRAPSADAEPDPNAPDPKREAQRRLYRRMLDVAQRSRTQAAKVRAALAAVQDQLAAVSAPLARRARRLQEQLDAFLPKVEKVVAAARRRTQWGEGVAARDKCLSLFAEHTQVIQRGKARKAHDTTEFGRKLWVSEVEGGIVSDVVVLAQPNQDPAFVTEAVERHRQQFGRVPRAVTGDRGLYSAGNEAALHQQGVRRLAFPATGKPAAGRREQEKQRGFRELYRWRAGIEGRISVLKRGFGLDSCPYHGAAGMQRWVAWGVLAHNLRQIARQTAA